MKMSDSKDFNGGMEISKSKSFGSGIEMSEMKILGLRWKGAKPRLLAGQ